MRRLHSLRGSSLFGFIALAGCGSHAAPTPSAPQPVVSAGPSPSASPAASASASPPGSPSPPGPEAPAAGKMCGGIAGFRCAAQQYCAFPISAHCGAGDMAGVCKALPEACTMELAEVCGCDGKTYGNACTAARSGVSMASLGKCADAAIADGKLCGTRGVPGECAQGSYCAYRAQCGATDAGGVCTKKPEVCADSFVPVCGCDGKTYPNACSAGSAGVSVSSKGACKGAGPEKSR